MKKSSNDNWLIYLTKTKEKNINYEQLKAISQNKNNLVYEYVKRSLKLLDSLSVSDEVYYYVSETLKWMDVAKCGRINDRKTWQKQGFELKVHNIASAKIYCLDNPDYDEIVNVLIKTHGLVGQYIRGEVKLSKNAELTELIKNNLISKKLLKEILIALNYCVVGAVNIDLYNSLALEIEKVIDLIVNDQYQELDIIPRMKRLNKNIKEEDYELLNDSEIKKAIETVFDNLELWYYEVALNDFTLLEQIKILLFIYKNMDNANHLTFEGIMKSMYIDYEGKKRINIYKKRVIEMMLKEISIDDILSDNITYNPHVKCDIKRENDTLSFDFTFSIQALKLIEFCEVAYTSNSLYNKAVYMLYDLFGFRRDQFDRFYNEFDYLQTMNSSMDNKKVLIDYVVGKKVLDVGPGGGGMLDLLEESGQDFDVFGIDISSNVIDELNKKKITENRKWNLIQGDALNLENYFDKNSIDTIIYSSIIHELYSYIPFNGKKFNLDTVVEALKSSYNIIPVGGRIIIRDGIKTEPDTMRKIVFKDKNDMKILNNYCRDFKGRAITYEKLDEQSVKMPVNDAMEFLYTYTWGENSYSLEVQEQFGYLTPSEYVSLIENNLVGAKIVLCEAFLQKGYEENLLNKISIYDDKGNTVKLPNSTCIIVIEKGSL